MTGVLSRGGNLDTSSHRGKTVKRPREKTATEKAREGAQKHPNPRTPRPGTSGFQNWGRTSFSFLPPPPPPGCTAFLAGHAAEPCYPMARATGPTQREGFTDLEK